MWYPASSLRGASSSWACLPAHFSTATQRCCLFWRLPRRRQIHRRIHHQPRRTLFRCLRARRPWARRRRTPRRRRRRRRCRHRHRRHCLHHRLHRRLHRTHPTCRLSARRRPRHRLEVVRTTPHTATRWATRATTGARGDAMKLTPHRALRRTRSPPPASPPPRSSPRSWPHAPSRAWMSRRSATRRRPLRPLLSIRRRSCRCRPARRSRLRLHPPSTASIGW